MKRLVVVSSLFLAFLFFGGLWVTLVRFIPAGTPRTVAAIAFGAVFVGTFAWLLIRQIQRVLSGVDKLWPHLLQMVVTVALLITAFAFVYQKLGIIDGQTGEETKDMIACLYFSVVTFTTLGYGDYYPYGLSRPMAALEALTGYLILGTLVSTSVSIIDPRNKVGAPTKDDEDEEAAE
jgi:hypothetical protein